MKKLGIVKRILCSKDHELNTHAVIGPGTLQVNIRDQFATFVDMSQNHYQLGYSRTNKSWQYDVNVEGNEWTYHGLPIYIRNDVKDKEGYHIGISTLEATKMIFNRLNQFSETFQENLKTRNIYKNLEPILEIKSFYDIPHVHEFVDRLVDCITKHVINRYERNIRNISLYINQVSIRNIAANGMSIEVESKQDGISMVISDVMGGNYAKCFRDFTKHVQRIHLDYIGETDVGIRGYNCSYVIGDPSDFMSVLTVLLKNMSPTDFVNLIDEDIIQPLGIAHVRYRENFNLLHLDEWLSVRECLFVYLNIYRDVLLENSTTSV